MTVLSHALEDYHQDNHQQILPSQQLVTIQQVSLGVLVRLDTGCGNLEWI
jgi:hypothetical protein